MKSRITETVCEIINNLFISGTFSGVEICNRKWSCCTVHIKRLVPVSGVSEKWLKVVIFTITRDQSLASSQASTLCYIPIITWVYYRWPHMDKIIASTIFPAALNSQQEMCMKQYIVLSFLPQRKLSWFWSQGLHPKITSLWQNGFIIRHQSSFDGILLSLKRADSCIQKYEQITALFFQFLEQFR